MPSGQKFLLVVPQPQPDPPQTQAKVCSFCHAMLDSAGNGFFTHEANSPLICGGCRERSSSSARDLIFPTDNHTIYLERGTTPHTPHDAHPTRLNISGDRSTDHDSNARPPPSSPLPSGFGSSFGRPLPSERPPHSANRPLLSHADTSRWQTKHPVTAVHSAGGSTSTSPDPLLDITHLRVRSRGRHCLYPGASFQGTQKSGRSSYDVNVTIVDVDFASSFLCGYLRIRGLTDDWPELTTYFDAEIIGSRYGFLTQNWGATEQEDMVHWSRFSAFRNLKNEFKKPYLTISDRDRGAVFMRWKEKFLVPDHRVQDISGASFAGFYYVCVDFNPSSAPLTRSSGPPSPLTHETANMNSSGSFASPLKGDITQQTRVDSGADRGHSSFPAPRSNVPTMDGFYFHQTSEPYQHLSLSYVPERTSSTFEFR